MEDIYLSFIYSDCVDRVICLLVHGLLKSCEFLIGNDMKVYKKI